MKLPSFDFQLFDLVNDTPSHIFVNSWFFNRTYEKEEIMGDDYEYVSYKSPKTIVAETVYHFFRGGLYGAAFGLVSVRSDI